MATMVAQGSLYAPGCCSLVSRCNLIQRSRSGKHFCEAVRHMLFILGDTSRKQEASARQVRWSFCKSMAAGTIKFQCTHACANAFQMILQPPPPPGPGPICRCPAATLWKQKGCAVLTFCGTTCARRLPSSAALLSPASFKLPVCRPVLPQVHISLRSCSAHLSQLYMCSTPARYYCSAVPRVVHAVCLPPCAATGLGSIDSQQGSPFAGLQVLDSCQVVLLCPRQVIQTAAAVPF